MHKTVEISYRGVLFTGNIRKDKSQEFSGNAGSDQSGNRSMIRVKMGKTFPRLYLLGEIVEVPCPGTIPVDEGIG
jgi:hypothetical protein